MNVLLVYPGPRHSTYDVALGYHEALAMAGHQVSPFNFHDYIDYHAHALAGLSNYKLAVRLASEHLVVHAVDVQPDVVLIVSGLGLDRHTYSLLRKLRIPTAIMLTESPYQDAEQAPLREWVDLAFTNDRVSVERLGATYLPASFSKTRHTPGHGSKNVADVFFVGTFFNERKALFDGLDVRGVNLGDATYPNQRLVDGYRGAKIALNHHRTSTHLDRETHIGQAYSLGPRAYEIAACGAFQLCDDSRAELREVFGDSVATYHDRSDLLGKIAYYLTHDEERWEMAVEARRRVTPCSFEDRAREILIPALERL